MGTPLPPYPNHPLILAARRVDGIAEELGAAGAVELLGMSDDVLAYLAQQRALRLVLVLSGRYKEIELANQADTMTPIELDELETVMHGALAVATYDGVAIGWSAAQSANDNDLTAGA